MRIRLQLLANQNWRSNGCYQGLACALGSGYENDRRADMDGLRRALDGANLSNCIESDDINDCWMKWKANFLSVVKTYIPTKRIKGRNFPPWMNGNIMYEIRKKEAVRKKLKSSPSDSLNNRFKQLRANVKKLIRESRSKFFSSQTPPSKQTQSDFGQFSN